MFVFPLVAIEMKELMRKIVHFSMSKKRKEETSTACTLQPNKDPPLRRNLPHKPEDHKSDAISAADWRFEIVVSKLMSK
jgi:hypothetical protein